MTKPQPLQHGVSYHIFNRGVNRCNLFTQVSDYELFLKLYTRYIDPIAETFAYCLMRNHFHLFVRIKVIESDRNPASAPTPSQSFSNLFNAYTKIINPKYDRVGSLFAHPFHRLAVTTDAYFTQLVTYIHRNPQKHGFVDDFREWPYSSYAAMLSSRPTRVQRGPVLAWFDGTEQFIAAHETVKAGDDIVGVVDDE